MSEETSSATPEESAVPPTPAAPATPTPPVTPERTYQRRRMFAIVGMALLGLGIIAFAILGARAFSSRMDAAKKVDEATVLIQDADKLVVEIDEVVRAKVTPELAEQARGAEARVTGAERMLDEAVALIDEAAPDLNEDEKERAALLRATAVARLEMLEPAPAILKLNAEAASAMPLGNDAWKAVLAADDLSDKAVASYNKLTKAGVTQSQKLNKQAAGQLGEAKDRFDAAEKAFSAAPFEQYGAYVGARIALNKLSQQSDAAWLKGDIAKANSLISTYNSQDRAAVAMAKELPSSPDAAIAKAFDESSKVQTEAYYAARKAALAADAKLREY